MKTITRRSLIATSAALAAAASLSPAEAAAGSIAINIFSVGIFGVTGGKGMLTFAG